MTTPRADIELARRYYKADLAVIPPREDGSKAPMEAWTRYQSERPSPATIKVWYGKGREGIGTITGKVSGNLEMFEFDDYNTYVEFMEAAKQTGLGALVERIESGYSEKTPGDGIHWHYRCPEIAGNTKLAQRLKTPEEMKDPNDKVKVLIETRGEGGFSVMAPSGGRVHPTGRPYQVLAGSVETIATITPEERKLLWDLARTFHELHREERTWPAQSSSDDERPGDVFNKQTTWADILEPHGWKKVFARGGVTHWRRPGKDIGTSATTGYTEADTLMVFSSSTPFDVSPASYSKFGAYALLNHKGDQSAAARALWEKNAPRASGVWLPPARAAEQPGAAELPPAPAYPIDALPPVVRTYVLEAAASLGIEPDMIATAILPIAAAVLGKGVSIELKRGWVERPQVWVANVGEPGSAKSPAHRFAMLGINALQAAAHKQYREEWERYEQDMASWAAAKPAGRGPKPQEPTERHFFSSDATIEAVAPMLMGSTRGLLLEHDELAGWLKGMDSFKPQGRGKERQQHLSLWDGKEVKVDRKGRPSIYLDEPVVSVVGGIQPDRLPEITRGQRDGFPDRILWAYPETQVVGWTDAEVPDRSTAEYVALFQRLASLSGKYRLSADALSAWKAWDRENVGIMKEEENVTRGMAAKLPRQLARVALILHCLGAKEPEAEVSAATLADAIAIIEYHREMGRRVLGGSGSTRQGGLRDRVLRILRDARGEEVCTFARLHVFSTKKSNSSLSNYPCLSRRTLLARLGGHVPASDLGPVLEALVAEGLVSHHETEPDPRGGRPGSHFSLTRANEQTEQTASPAQCKNGCGYFLLRGEACSDCGEVAQ